jgi:hypothetical protein
MSASKLYYYRSNRVSIGGEIYGVFIFNYISQTGKLVKDSECKVAYMGDPGAQGGPM